MKDVRRGADSESVAEAADKTAKDSRRLVPVKNNPGIYKRGNRYVVVYRVGRQRKQEKRFARTLAEARLIQSERRSDRDVSTHRRGQMLFTDYAKWWVENYAGRTGREAGLKEQTRADYEAAVTRSEFVKHFHGLRLAEIEASHIREYGDVLAQSNGQRRPLSPRTGRNLIVPVRLMLADAKDDNYIRTNPAAGLKVKAALGGSDEDARPLFDDEKHGFELQRLLSVLPEASPQMRLLIELLLQTGIRIGEALALTWADVRFEETPVVGAFAIDLEPRGDERGFFGIVHRYEHRLYAAFLCLSDERQDAAYAPELTVKRELADKKVGLRIKTYIVRSEEIRNGDREIEHRPLFAEVCRRERYDYLLIALLWRVEPRMLDR